MWSGRARVARGVAELVVTDDGSKDGLPYFEDLESSSLHLTVYAETGEPKLAGIKVSTSPTTISVKVQDLPGLGDLVVSAFVVGRAYAS
jgi:hypothetical protein